MMRRMLLYVMLLIVSPQIQAADAAEAVEVSSVRATAETVAQPKADGVAIWINEHEPESSLVIGADPRRGLRTFDLGGQLRQNIQFEGGGAAEVDVRYGIELASKPVALVAGAINKANLIYVYSVNPESGELIDAQAEPVATENDAYGSCLYHSQIDQKLYLFVTSKQGRIVQFELTVVADGRILPRKVRQFDLNPPDGDGVVEACAADDHHGWLYLCQENHARVWRFQAEPDASDEKLLVLDAATRPTDNTEGVAIWDGGAGAGYLLVSIQSSWEYRVYDRVPDPVTNVYPLLGRFSLEYAGRQVESHDCIEVANVPFGSIFPGGLFVVQDSAGATSPNYKLVDWSAVSASLNLAP